nr:putative ribonuclease H-like domain-containing protein [Tanacetum cinerariifolium]
MSANDKFGLGYGDYRYGSILSYENEVLQSVFMNKESDLENTSVNDRYAKEMHAVPPPMTKNYMPSGPDWLFNVTPKTSHLQAVKKIFRYLKGQPKLGLWYPKVSSFDLEAYSDSDYVGANLDRKSTTGGCQFLGKRFISWQCKKQTIVATSTTEAEYVVVAYCCG